MESGQNKLCAVASPDDLSSERTASRLSADSVAKAAPAVCYHCGERCGDRRFSRGEKVFCCNGCLTVHDLLAENGLGHFYELNQNPGLRRREISREEFGYLDTPAVRQRLLDFDDGKTSRVTFRIPAIHCVACVWLLENLFRLHPGIGLARVNFTRRELAITFLPERIGLSEVVALLVSIGYEPSLTLGELDPRSHDPLARRRWLQVGVAGFAFGNIMLFSLPRYFGSPEASLQITFGCLSLILALPVLLFSASDFWKAAWASIGRRTVTLDLPIALGVAALYSQSAWEILTGRGGGYLDSLTGLVFFLLCGRAFQRKIHDRLAFDRDYKSFFPLSATRIVDALSANGPETAGKRARQRAESVSISELRIGDRLFVRHGELIPADAVLLSGEALIDYSFVTGEAAPIRKCPGEYLYAGGKQTGAAIEIRTVKNVSQGYLSSLWNDDAFAKTGDDSVSSVTNRYSRWFIRAVLLAAAGAALFWTFAGDWPRGLKAFTSVLIVACPCALALAAPFALGTALRWLARAKIFVKNILVLERLARVDTIVFDKTGTLTTTADCFATFTGPALSPAEAECVNSLARHSTHPLAQPIAASLATGKNLPVDRFREIAGSGVEGTVAGRHLRLGSWSWLAENGIAIPPRTDSDGGQVWLAIDGEFRGAFVVSACVRAELTALLPRLQQRFDTVLLSGDHDGSRPQWKGLFRDDQLYFNQTPAGKLEFVRKLQAMGKTVAMVGDGLNDAGALRQSDVGIAVVAETGVFSPTSDVIIEAAQLGRLTQVFQLAKTSTRIVWLCLGISALYNVVGVGIAAGGWLSPVICALLMPLSSVSVVFIACAAATWAARHLQRPVEVRKPRENEGAEENRNAFPSSFAIRPSSFLKP